MSVDTYRINDMGNESRAWWISLISSMICHLIFFSALILFPGFESRRSFSQPVINVSLVTLPASPETEIPQRNAAESETRAEPMPDSSAKADVHPKSPVHKAVSNSLQSYKPKVSLKQKTLKTEKVLEKAIAEIEKKVDQSKPEPVEKAIEHLRDTIGETKYSQRLPSVNELDAQGRKPLDAMDIYKAEIPFRIQKNWAFSEQLAGGRTDLVAWLVIEIMPNGDINDIWFEKRSGNRYFDDQAYKAVKKSNPLPPLPEGYTRPYFNVGLRFTPSGLK